MIKKILIAGVAISLLAGSFAASAKTKIRLTLDWVPQSTHGPSFIAQYEGYFKAEGLDVKIDAGKGSADAVRKLVAGTHDLGWADINAIIQYNSKNPKRAIKTVMMLYEQPPFSICVLAKSSIKSPKQLVGKTLGAPVFDASYKLFPAFAQAIGIDHNSVKRLNMDDTKQISKIRRISVIMIVLWIPITIMLSMLGVFGDFGEDRAVIFWIGGELFWIILLSSTFKNLA